jgi:GxxExxY protein
MTNSNEKILYKELSYKLQGIIFDIRNDLGSGHKESIYQKALEKELISAGIKFIKEPSIKIYSQKREFLGLYRPDFLIEDKIIVELKAAEYVSKQEIARVYDYLRNSKYELAYFVNFASPRLYIKRLIFTNDRKTRIATNIKRIVANLIIFVAISGLFVGIREVLAAELSLDSSVQEVSINQQFKVDVILDTENESINAIEGKIIFPSDLLELKDINEANSIVNFWIDNPQIAMNKNASSNEVIFSGIVPGGYTGRGLIFSMVFQTKKAGEGLIEIKDIKALLNDGRGSETKSTFQNLFVAIRGDIRGYSWSTPEDTEPPEDFKPEIASDSTIFDGKWFLVFATQDKASGVDHYEVLEFRSWNLEFRKIVKKVIKVISYSKFQTPDSYEIAESPHLLKDQKLRSWIYVKAIDKAGNERIVSLPPRYPLKWYERWEIWGIIMLGIVIGHATKKFLWKIIHE